MRLIDADKLYPDCLTKEGTLAISQSQIANAPTVKTFTLEDIEEQYRKGLEKGLSEWETERPTGHWVNGYKSFNCSVCGKIAYSWNQFGEYIQVKSNFCPNCGAEMRKEEEE